jgi:F0F1-type ATP synthase assembly protein I
MLPFIVFPAAAVVAIFIGWLLHQVPRTVAPVVALILTLLVTGAGFFFSSRAGRS